MGADSVVRGFADEVSCEGDAGLGGEERELTHRS